MQCYWQSPLLDQQRDAKEWTLQILAPAPGGKLKKRRGALGCKDWFGASPSARAESLNMFCFFFLIYFIILFYFLLMWKEPCCPFLPAASGCFILPRGRGGGPVAVPSPATVTSPRAPRAPWVVGIAFPPSPGSKSKEQPQKTCRDRAQVGVITIFRFLQCKKNDTHI